MHMRPFHILLLLGCLLAGSTLWAEPALAQRSGQTPAAFEGVDMDERLGETIPTDIVFHDENGEDVTLDAYFDGEKPVVLNLVYHNCTMLCNVVLDSFTKSLAALDWTPGDEFEILTVSFNAIETADLARRQKERYVQQLGKPEAAPGWHFLTGTEASIERLTQAVGFQYRWVEAQQEFAHPAALIFLSGTGKITRYLYGVDVPASDLRPALVEASEGTVGTPLDQIFLFCFHYDPQANSYVANATNLMRLGGVLTVLALGFMLVFFWRREGRKHRLENGKRAAGDSRSKWELESG